MNIYNKAIIINRLILNVSYVYLPLNPIYNPNGIDIVIYDINVGFIPTGPFKHVPLHGKKLFPSQSSNISDN